MRELTAADLAEALGGRREGASYRCPCPEHLGRSLIVTERHGRVLFNCKAGCGQDEVLARLVELGLFGGGRIDPLREEERRRREEEREKAEIDRLKRRISAARAIYDRAVPASGTAAECYLESRGITPPVPRCLRFMRHCPHRNGGYFPAMDAPIVNAHGEQTGLHKTFVKPDGSPIAANAFSNAGLGPVIRTVYSIGGGSGGQSSAISSMSPAGGAGSIVYNRSA